MNKRDLLEAGLAVLVGSWLMFGIQKKIEREIGNAACDGYNGITYIMKPIAESLKYQEKEKPTEQIPVYLVRYD